MTHSSRLRSIVQARARGENFRIPRVAGNLFVCSRANGSCCCGWEEKGRMPFDNSLWGAEWERRRHRNRLQLTFSGCLGPCAVGNNALLQLHGRSIWLKDLNEPWLIGAIFDYAEAMLDAGRALSPPGRLAEHVYDRYLALADGAIELVPKRDIAEVAAGLDGLDPVCLMEVDPVTARHTTEREGRTLYFCAPSCKKQFLADPTAYSTP